MIYTIAYGENSAIVISLDRKGSTYSVSIWNRAKHAFDLFEDFSSTEFDMASKRFSGLCHDNNLEPKKIDRDASDFTNID
jgi:hypothetical protein